MQLYLLATTSTVEYSPLPASSHFLNPTVNGFYLTMLSVAKVIQYSVHDNECVWGCGGTVQ